MCLVAGDADRTGHRFSQRAALALIPVVAIAWLAAIAISVLDRRWQPFGDCTVGTALSVCGLSMLVADRWPGKTKVYRGGLKNPLAGWYGRVGPIFLSVVGLLILVGTLLRYA
jgi:hypothetical protein